VTATGVTTLESSYTPGSGLLTVVSASEMHWSPTEFSYSPDSIACDLPSLARFPASAATSSTRRTAFAHQHCSCESSRTPAIEHTSCRRISKTGFRSPRKPSRPTSPRRSTVSMHAALERRRANKTRPCFPGARRRHDGPARRWMARPGGPRGTGGKWDAGVSFERNGRNRGKPRCAN
jgi:hypothetical protein